MHRQIPYFKMISWDIAIDKKGEFILIEYNVLSQGILGQYTTGPLFGELTDDVLKSCKKNSFWD